MVDSCQLDRLTVLSNCQPLLSNCQTRAQNAERGEARRGGGNSDWRDERRAGGRRDGVDGTGETRTVEVFVRGDPRWDPKGEYKRFRAAFGDG